MNLRFVLCVFRGHAWRVPRFRALNAMAGEYSVICVRCGRWEDREALCTPKATTVDPSRVSAEAEKDFRAAESALLGMRWTPRQAEQLIKLVEQGRKA